MKAQIRFVSVPRNAADCLRHGRCSMAWPKAVSRRRLAARGGTRKNAAPKNASYSFETDGQWDPKNQRPELWNLYNSRIDKGRAHSRVSRSRTGQKSMSGSTSSAKTFLIVPLVLRKNASYGGAQATLCYRSRTVPLLPGREPEMVMCRMRSLGCSPLHGRDPL